MEETAGKERDKYGRFLPGNTTGFQKGLSGNPSGRPPKDFSLTSVAKAMLEANPEKIEAMVRKWLDQVLEGKTEARRDLQDRLEGKVPDKGEGRIVLEVNFVIGKGYEDAVQQ